MYFFKNKRVILPLFAFLLVGLLNTNVFADSKKTLEQIVMEHENKISTLINDVNILKEGKGGTNQELSEVTKQALLKEYSDRMLGLINPDEGLKLVDSKIVEKDGKNVFQVYTEGTAGYTTQQDSGNFEPGKVLAYNFAQSFNTINTMYNVNLSLEFYHNGQRVTTFVQQ